MAAITNCTSNPGPTEGDWWMIDCAPCWKCGVEEGTPCITRFGQYTLSHMPRVLIANALIKWTGNYILSDVRWQDIVSPRVDVVCARREWKDNRTPDRPIQPGEHYYKWTPHGMSDFRSRTRPVVNNGVLFWPLENP